MPKHIPCTIVLHLRLAINTEKYRPNGQHLVCFVYSEDTAYYYVIVDFLKGLGRRCYFSSDWPIRLLAGTTRSVFRNSTTTFCSSTGRAPKASRSVRPSPPCSRIASVIVLMSPRWPYGAELPTSQSLRVRKVSAPGLPSWPSLPPLPLPW